MFNNIYYQDECIRRTEGKKRRQKILLYDIKHIYSNKAVKNLYIFNFTGTTAKVSFILTGEKEETSPRFLADEKRPVLQASNIDGFVMAVPKSLGKLTHLRYMDNKAVYIGI